MKFEELGNILFDELGAKLRNHKGLAAFARERAKFEGWLKVEVCSSLIKHCPDITPEKNRVDITFSNWAIELKTANTNIRYPNVRNKQRPITKNISGIIEDINTLKGLPRVNAAVFFVAFPTEHSNVNWPRHIDRIKSNLKKLIYKEFGFSNDVPGVMYFGLVKTL